jgi:O-antigen/teichoic acid export membrane protein
MIKNGIARIKLNKQFSNLVVYGIGQGFNLVTPLLVIPYIISVCGLENYGKAAFGMALTFFMIVFIDYGSDIIGVKEVATNREDPDQLEKIFITTYATKLTILIGVLFLGTVLFLLVPYFRAEQLLFFLGLPILIGQFLNPTWFLQGIENYKQITSINILSKSIYLIGVFIFVTSESDYIYINLFWGIGMIVANGISLIQVFKRYSFTLIHFNKRPVSDQLQHNFSMFSSQIFVSVQLYAPLILIGFFGNPVMAGIYRVIDQIVVIFKTYLLLFFNFAFPRICYLLGSNEKEGTRFWTMYNGANFLFILASMVGIYFFAEPIVHYFHPTGGAYLSKLLQFALLIPIMMAVSLPLKQLVLGYNHQKFYINSTMLLVVSNVIIIMFTIPYFEIYGVLASLILLETVTAILFFFKIKNRLYQR